tara:strand:+ start:41 stop:457 length:417 start_codon:yes stop_codon:yes gene_type:complete
MNAQDRIAQLEAQVADLQSQLEGKNMIEYVIPTQNFWNDLTNFLEDPYYADSQYEEMHSSWWCTQGYRISVSKMEQEKDLNALKAFKSYFLLAREPLSSPLTRNQMIEVLDEFGLKMPEKLFKAKLKRSWKDIHQKRS